MGSYKNAISTKVIQRINDEHDDNEDFGYGITLKKTRKFTYFIFYKILVHIFPLLNDLSFGSVKKNNIIF